MAQMTSTSQELHINSGQCNTSCSLGNWDTCGQLSDRGWNNDVTSEYIRHTSGQVSNGEGSYTSQHVLDTSGHCPTMYTSCRHQTIGHSCVPHWPDEDASGLFGDISGFPRQLTGHNHHTSGFNPIPSLKKSYNHSSTDVCGYNQSTYTYNYCTTDHTHGIDGYGPKSSPWQNNTNIYLNNNVEYINVMNNTRMCDCYDSVPGVICPHNESIYQTNTVSEVTEYHNNRTGYTCDIPESVHSATHCSPQKGCVDDGTDRHNWPRSYNKDNIEYTHATAVSANNWSRSYNKDNIEYTHAADVSANNWSRSYNKEYIESTHATSVSANDTSVDMAELDHGTAAHSGQTAGCTRISDVYIQQPQCSLASLQCSEDGTRDTNHLSHNNGHAAVTCDAASNSNDTTEGHSDTSGGEHTLVTDMNREQHTTKLYSTASLNENEHKLQMITHRNNLKYVCDICKRILKTSSDLRHMSIHAGQKTYICEDCDKTFRLQSILMNHVSIHSGQKPYVCSKCEKCFRTKGHLKTHIMKHIGEKPYMCTQCGKTFYRK